LKGSWTESSKKYRYIGGGLTLLWAVLIGAYLIVKCINPLDLKPNEFGDFLAGILGPLGILWIVLGFWQQGDELRSSVDALNLQSEELKNSVEQQKALVEVTREQAEAEVSALNEERTARRLANMPVLRLSSSGGSASRDVRNNLALRNLGSDCSDVRILDWELEGKVITSLPTLAYSETHTFTLIHPRESHLDFEIEITYRSRSGEIYSDKFRLTRASDATVGFAIEPIAQ